MLGNCSRQNRSSSGMVSTTNCRDVADKIMETHFRPIEGHRWYFEGMSKDAIEQVRKGFEERYGKGALK